MRKVSTLAYCDRTDVGRRRANNQDSRSVLPASPQEYRGRGWLFLVADGMGAHAAGEKASAMAAEGVPRAYAELTEFCPPLALKRSIEKANAIINRKGERTVECHGMGTTCTVLVLHPRGAIVGHVGDSRAYRVRHHTIDQLSRDHSLAWEIEAAMGANAEEAGGAIPKNIITRSLGPHAKVDVDLEGPFPVEAGDTFILCSDGLTGVVSDAEIGLFAAELEAAAAVAALVGLALVRGAPDNVTVIGVRAGEEEVSRRSRGDEPWPLSEEATSTQRQGRWAWASLVMAAVGLLLALTINPWSLLTKTLCAENALVRTICLATSVCGGLLAAGGGLFGTVSFLTTTRRGRVLQAGDHIGKGPYRTHDCTPTPGLVAGVVASLEAAADALPATTRERTVGITAHARQHAAAGAYHEAVLAVAEAISVHVDEIEAGRRDGTVRIEPPAPPHA